MSAVPIPAVPHEADTDADVHFMRLALEQAQIAASLGEVPVGAVVVHEGKVVARAHNQPLRSSDPTGHAELLAVRAAAQALGNYRLDGCTLYVTLEPCAMCAGAMLHGRIQRLVFGAWEEKTGAAGSVVNLFDHPQLNHQTTVRSGVLAQECAQVLQAFFQSVRAHKRLTAAPLREDALRTPLACFDSVPDYLWPASYADDLLGLAGWRMHYLDLPATVALAVAASCDGAASKAKPLAATTVLFLHGAGQWSWVFKAMFTPLQEAGLRIVAPDLIGFGKSDKPKRAAVHSLDFHRGYIENLLLRLDLQRVVLVVQGWSAQLAQAFSAAIAQRVCAVVVVPDVQGVTDANTVHVAGQAGALASSLDAPFPDAGYRAALRADVFRRHPVASAAWPAQWQHFALDGVGVQDANACIAWLRGLEDAP